jgi:hypothetical protein
MGVEPTAARSARPASGFEDRGSHRATTTPVRGQSYRVLPRASSRLDLTVQPQHDIFCGAGRSNLKWLQRTIRSGLRQKRIFHGSCTAHYGLTINLFL